MITKTFDSCTSNIDTPITYVLYDSITSESDWRSIWNRTETDKEV